MSNTLKLNEIINLTYVGLMGCNSELNQLIEKFYKEKYPHLSNPIFCFYEYLTHNPLNSNNTINQDEVYFIAPFIQRFSKKNSFGFDPDNIPNNKIIPLTDKNIAKSAIKIRLTDSMYLKNLYDNWRNSAAVDSDLVEKNDAKSDCIYYKQKNYTKTKLNNYIKQSTGIIKDEDKPVEEIESAKSQYFEGGFIKSMVGSWPQGKRIISYIIPLASKNYFYGQIILWFPFFHAEGLEEALAKLISNIIKIINNRYIPTLSIIHEHIIENNIQEGQTSCNITIREGTDSKIVPYNNYYKSSENPGRYGIISFIESSIKDLWDKRTNNKVDYEDSLIYKKYIVSSPEMIQLLSHVIRRAKVIKINNDSLPSVVIVGSAGAGKNNIIEFLKIYSSVYSKGKTYFQNMAGLKPDNLVPSMLMGEGDNNGIFDEIRDITISRIYLNEFKDKPQDELDDFKKSNPIFPTIVFDEFNSLNIDAQGILLRFIDNSEIIKIGAISDELFSGVGDDKVLHDKIKYIYNDFLLIGVMNEEPDELSRDSAIEFLNHNNYIKGLVSDIFYEYILKIRRLRPDIKYRMVRGGKFKVPDLKKRKYDIPILFYVFLKLNLNTNTEIHITFSALEKLIDPNLMWPGNIRQLQAVTKIVADYIAEKNELSDEPIIVNDSDIQYALETNKMI